MATATQAPRQLIINGSVNPRLTEADLEAADYSTKVSALWSLQVQCEYPRMRSDIDPNAVAKLEQTYTYAEIQAIPATQLNAALLTELRRQQRHHEYAYRETYAKDVTTGREIRRMQSKLGFGGELELSLGKLVGYLLEGGDWNYFDAFAVGRVLKSLHESAPRRNCGENNPNTGNVVHTWAVQNDYIFLKVPYLSGEEVEAWQQWYRHTASAQQKTLKADSMRLVVEPIEGFHKDAANLTLVMWWD